MTSAVTVVIPVHNGSRFLGRTLESLVNQDARGFSIVCVDDASTDDSRAVVESFAREGVRYIRNDRPLGLAGNWNRAVEQVTTPFFVIAHQDDVYESDYISRMVPLISALPKAFMAHCKTVTIDGEDQILESAAARYKEILWPRADTYEHDIHQALPRLARGNYIVCPSAIFRTHAVRDIGPFDSSYEFVTDWEYWVRGLAKRYTIGGTGARLVRFRRHEATATKSAEQTFARYREEAAMEVMIDRVAAAAGIRLRARGPVRRIVLSELGSLLREGDLKGAAALRLFAIQELPGFQDNVTAALLAGVLRLGRTGGHLLKVLEKIALFLSYQHARLLKTRNT